MELIFISIAVFVAVSGAAWVISSRATAGQHSVVQGRLKSFKESSDVALNRGPIPVRKSTRKDDIFHQIDTRIFQKKSFFQKMILEFQKADLSLRYSEYLGLYLLMLIFPGLIAFIFTKQILFVMLASALGAFVPRTYVKLRQVRRIRNIDNQLVDALILISNSLKSGYSFLQGLELVAEEAPRPICVEFSRVMRETNLGMDVEASLDAMTERVPSEDLDLVITAVKIQRQIGGNLSEILDRIIHTIRERIRIKGEINTLTAQGKLQGIILTLLPLGIAIGIYGMAPDFMAPLFTTLLGKMMIGVAFILQFIGGFFIKKIVEIKV
ncbi:MAG: type II secretion system F family protein [bacterium]